MCCGIVYGFLSSTGLAERILDKLGLALGMYFNPLGPNNDLTQTSHCNIKGLSVSEVMRIENMITQVQFY